MNANHSDPPDPSGCATGLRYRPSHPPELSRAEKTTNEKSAFAKATADTVGWTGFEPATSCTPCKCATGLRHHPKGLQIYMKLTLKKLFYSTINKGLAIDKLFFFWMKLFINVVTDDRSDFVVALGYRNPARMIIFIPDPSNENCFMTWHLYRTNLIS